MERKPSVEDVLRKYGAKIEEQIATDDSLKKNYSSSYEKFRSEMTREYTGYEKMCHTLGSFIKLKISKKDFEKINKDLELGNIQVYPWQAIGLAMMSFLSIFFLSVLISVSIGLIRGLENFPILFLIMSLFASIFVFNFLQNYPSRLARKWRLKASSQMVPAILYIVVYMRHTSNLEKAIQFASEHLEPPLAMDFRKIFYNVEVGKYSTIQESLNAYLETWKDFSTEFIESFHLIESSLFEADPGRRISILEKSLQVVLDGVYDKMLKFSHGVRSPLTNVYMLGVVMPTLALALIPLASAMAGEFVTAQIVFILFNVLGPFFVFFMTDKILMMRPGGHGEISLLENNPLYYQYKSNKGYAKGIFRALPFLIIGIIPLLVQIPGLMPGLGLEQDYTFNQLGLSFLGGEEYFFNYIIKDGVKTGPFGLGALLLGMFFPLGIAIFFITAYKEKTKNLILEREKTKKLETEFNSSLFQLGNELGNGVPPELVFGRVANINKGLEAENFFVGVNYNIRRLGMSVESAIFDKKVGMIRKYPSSLISTSMKLLVESAKKGLKIAAVSLMSISQYIKNLDKITIRLKDLLAEVTSDMKSNMTFLAPLLSGIVVGLGAMITSIVGKLSLSEMGESTSGTGFAFGESLSGFLSPENMISPYFLQIIVGIYLIEIIFILTGTLVTISSGEDKLEQRYKLAKYLKSGIGIYTIIAFIAVLLLTILSVTVLGGVVGG